MLYILPQSCPCSAVPLFKIHDSGLINYKGHLTRSDGALPSDVAQLEVKRAEAELEKLRANKDTNPTDLAAAEQRLEAALDATLEFGAELAEDIDFEEFCDADPMGGDDEDEDSDEDEEEKQKAESQAKDKQNSKQEQKTTPLVEAKQPSEPLSFSKIDVKYLQNPQKCTEFPLLAKAKPIVCTIRGGEMLYLPASWFHEVCEIHQLRLL